MRFGVIRVRPQYRLVLVASFCVPIDPQHKIGEVHPRHRISGMMQDRLGIDPAGGLDRAHLGQQRPEFVQCAEIFRGSPQDFDESPLRFSSTIQRSQQYGALNFGPDRISRSRLARQQIDELTQPCLLHQPGRPALLLGAVRQDNGVWLQSGHDLGKFGARIRISKPELCWLSGLTIG